MNRAAALLTLGILLVLVGCTPAPNAASARLDGGVDDYLGGTAIPTPFRMPAALLTDTAGQSYNLQTSPSKPVTLLFFGYTSCRDVCSAVLSDVAMGLRRLPQSDRDQIQVVFVTTDPARDTPAQIRRYLDRFNADFIGLTGSFLDVKAAGDQVGVEITGTSDVRGGAYAVGHSAQVIGFSRTHGVVLWEPGTPVGSLTHDFALLVERST